MNIRLKF